MQGLIDWDLAQRVGGMLAGRPVTDGSVFDRLGPIAGESLEAVVDYSRLAPRSPIPDAEVVSRQEWIDVNSRSLALLLDPALAGVSRPSRDARAGVHLLGEAVLTVEAGSVLGLLSRRVLGQYEEALVRGGEHPPPRLLFVDANLDAAMVSLGDTGDDFLRWVTIHEVTHAVQFGSVPWLRDHLGSLVGELVASLGSERRNGQRSLRGIAGEAVGRAGRSIRRRDPLALMMAAEEHRLVASLQSAMSLIEGHAEHVMDRADTDRLRTVPRLRAAMAERRRSPGPLWKVLGKVLGLELKMRQYETGRSFCDSVVDRAGVGALNLAWESPDALPSQRELDSPGLWLARVCA